MLEAARPHVVTIGETLLRLTPAHEGRLETAQTLRVTPGGAESNVAVALAAFGIPSMWVGALPRNPLGANIARTLAAAGVDVSHIRWDDRSRLGLYFVEAAAQPRPTVVYYDRAGSAGSRMTVDDFDPEVLVGASYLVFSGVLPGLSASGARLADAVVREAASQQVPLCFDVNYRARLWSTEDAAKSLTKIARNSSIFISSARDARLLFRADGDDEQVLRILRDAIAPEADLAVLTLGSRGALASTRGGDTFYAPAYDCRVVDRLGMGDAFVAGLLWGLSTQSPSNALAAANAAAALKATVFGDHLVGTADELRAIVSGESLGVLR